MKIAMTEEELHRPLGSDLSERAKRLLSRVGSINFGRNAVLDDAALDELEATIAEADKQFLTKLREIREKKQCPVRSAIVSLKD